MPSAPSLQVRELTPADEDGAIDVLVEAFANDPMGRWAFPDADQYREIFPDFLRAFAGAAFATGGAFGTQGGEGTALWLPPGVHSDEERLNELTALIKSGHMDEFMRFGELQSSIHPTTEHWYLPMLGVRPERQGLGAGSALLSHTLAKCDDQKLPAFLEATTENSRRLYQRHGFDVVGEIQYGSSPTLWRMWREPK